MLEEGGGMGVGGGVKGEVQFGENSVDHQRFYHDITGEGGGGRGLIGVGGEREGGGGGGCWRREGGWGWGGRGGERRGPVW